MEDFRESRIKIGSIVFNYCERKQTHKVYLFITLVLDKYLV